MKNNFLILCFIFISCTQNENNPESTSTATQKSNYACKDLDRGVVNFRKQCMMGLELYTNYRNGSDNKLIRWCDCYEKNFVWEDNLNESCEIENLATMRQRVNATHVQAKCKTPDTLL